MPKKHKPISGIGASSIFELKAHLYKAQQESKNPGKESNLPSSCFQHVDVHRAKKRIVANDPFAAKNHGVESRNHNGRSFGTNGRYEHSSSNIAGNRITRVADSGAQGTRWSLCFYRAAQGRAFGQWPLSLIILSVIRT
ncbi:hypothetical protein POM88_019423 [Heracleum sosnowskyi]|uniref:Uncharacterized protein n=1 Tax=Heracleum sosnowskyi TaxID=360622 RepID=A0AAD8IC36_9APIA|nr:hypothetical protein POM88_019423 [Heracleum sosnowskyi]